jgi:protein-disulfide isomerase
MSNSANRRARAAAMSRERQKSDTKQRNVITVAIVAVVVVLVAVAAWGISSVSSEPEVVATPKSTTAKHGVVVTGQDVGGVAPKPDAVKVVLYEDFLCPACAAFENDNGGILNGLLASGDITVEYRMVTFLDAQSTDRYSTRATNAALAVADDADAGAFYDMHRSLYDNQPAEGGTGLTDSELADLAKDAGATSDLSDIIGDVAYDGWIARATRDAGDVDSTPTVLVDGNPVEPTDLGWDMAGAVRQAQDANKR